MLGALSAKSTENGAGTFAGFRCWFEFAAALLLPEFVYFWNVLFSLLKASIFSRVAKTKEIPSTAEQNNRRPRGGGGPPRRWLYHKYIPVCAEDG